MRRRRGHASPGRAQELLLKAGLLEGEAALRAWAHWKRFDSIDGADLDSHRLFPLVCRNLLAADPSHPDLGRLKSVYRHAWVANLHRLDRAASAVRALHDAGLATMLLKGAALSPLHYRDFGTRPMRDVDVLVKTECAKKAAQVLESAGWSRVLTADVAAIVPVIQGTAFQDGAGGGIDLHWQALWAPASDDDFWSAAVPAEIRGVPTLAQCPADQLFHACVHGLWSEGPWLRWVADAVTVLRTTPAMDWERVVDRARARSLTLPLHDALEYLRAELGAPVPEEVMMRLDHAPSGLFERLGHRVWAGRPSRRKTAWLAVERYRRQCALPGESPGVRSFASYARDFAFTAWGLHSSGQIPRAMALRLRPGQPRSDP